MPPPAYPTAGTLDQVRAGLQGTDLPATTASPGDAVDAGPTRNPGGARVDFSIPEGFIDAAPELSDNLGRTHTQAIGLNLNTALPSPGGTIISKTVRVR